MNKNSSKEPDPSSQPPTYAAARGRLDRILRELEEGEVEVDVLADRVEEAAALVSFCRARLRAQEARLRKVAADLAAETEEELDEESSSCEEE